MFKFMWVRQCLAEDAGVGGKELQSLKKERISVMKSDIEIAQGALLEPIATVAAKLDMSQDDLELYGKYKAKITDEYMESLKDRTDGKLILVTAINPTPAGIKQSGIISTRKSAAPSTCSNLIIRRHRQTIKSTIP